MAQEYEQVNEVNKMLANFKKDPTPGHYGAARFEEPTRDPGVWPPPTPVEKDKRYSSHLLLFKYNTTSL